MRHRRGSFELVKRQQWKRRRDDQSRNIRPDLQRNINSNDSWHENTNKDKNTDWNTCGNKHYQTTDVRRPVHMFGNYNTFLDTRKTDSDVEVRLPPITLQSNSYVDTASGLPSIASFFDGGSNPWHSIPDNTMHNPMPNNDFRNLTSHAWESSGLHLNIPCSEKSANQNHENFNESGSSHSSTHVMSFEPIVQPTFSHGWNVNLPMERTLDVSDMSWLSLPPPPPPPLAPLPPIHSLQIGTANVQSTDDESRSKRTSYDSYSGCNINNDAGVVECKRKLSFITSTEREQIPREHNIKDFQGSFSKKNDHTMSVSLNSEFQNNLNVSKSSQQKFKQYPKQYMGPSLSGIGIQIVGHSDKGSFNDPPENPYLQPSGLTHGRHETSIGTVPLLQSFLECPLFPDSTTQMSANEASHPRDRNNNFERRHSAGLIQSKTFVSGITQNKDKLHRPWESLSPKDGYDRRTSETRDTFRHRSRQSQQENKHVMNRPDRRSWLTPHSSRPCYTKSAHRKIEKFKPYHGMRHKNYLRDRNRSLISSSHNIQSESSSDRHTSENIQHGKCEISVHSKGEISVHRKGETSVHRKGEMSVRRKDEMSVHKKGEMSLDRKDEMSLDRKDEMSVHRKGEMSVRRKDEMSVHKKGEMSVRRKDEMAVRRKDEMSVDRKDEMSVHRKDEMSVRRKDEMSVHPSKDYTVSSSGPTSHTEVAEKQKGAESNEAGERSSDEAIVHVSDDKDIEHIDSNTQDKCSTTEAEQPIQHQREAEKSTDQIDKSFLKKRQDKYNDGKPFTEITPVLVRDRHHAIQRKVRFEKEICAASSSTDIRSSKAETSSKFNSSTFNARNVVLPLEPSTVAMPLVNIDMSKLSDAVPKENRFLKPLSKVAKPEICLENKFLKTKEKINLGYTRRSNFKIPLLKSTTARNKIASNVKAPHKKIVCVSPMINKAIKRGKVEEKKEIDVSCLKMKEMKTKVTNKHPDPQKVTTDNSKSLTLQSTTQTKLHPKLRHKTNDFDEKCVINRREKLDKINEDCSSQFSDTSKDVLLSVEDSSKDKNYSTKLAQMPCCLKRGKFEMSTPNTFTVKGLPTKKTVIEKSECYTDVNLETFNKAMFSAKKHLLYRAMAMQSIAKDKTTQVQAKKNGQRTSCITNDMAEREIKNSQEPLLSEIFSGDKVSLTCNSSDVDANNNVVESSEKNGEIKKKSCNDVFTDYVPLRTTADCILTHCISSPQMSSAVQKSHSNTTDLSIHENDEFNDASTEVEGSSNTTKGEEVSMSTSKPVTVCVNDINENSYDSEATTYFASKLNLKPLKDTDSCKSTDELQFTADLIPTNCESDRVEPTSNLPSESPVNESQMDMYQRYVLSKLDVVSLSNESSEEVVQPVPGLPALLPPVPVQQTGIVMNVQNIPPSSGHTDYNDNCDSSQCQLSPPCQLSPSCTHNQMRFSPTVDDFERYKIDQIKRVKFLGDVDQKQSIYVSPVISSSSPVPLSYDMVYEQQQSLSCSVWSNAACFPKIECVESLNVSIAQSNDPDVSSSLRANPMIEFVNDMQYSPKAMFDEIVDDILKDNDLISSITETPEKTNGPMVAEMDVNDENEYQGKLSPRKSIEASPGSDSNAKSEFMSSRNYPSTTHRFQKRFPKPLPRSKMINKEKELYKAAEEFLGDFDHSSKRSCRDVLKDGTSPMNENSNKFGITESVKTRGETGAESVSLVTEKKSELNHVQSGKEQTRGRDCDVSMKPKESMKSKLAAKLKDGQSYAQCRDVDNDRERKPSIKEETETKKEVETEKNESKKKVTATKQKDSMHVPTLRLKTVKSTNGKESTKSGPIKWKAILSKVKQAKKEMRGDCMTNKLTKKSVDKKKIRSPQLRDASPLAKTTDFGYFCEVCEFPCDSEMSHRLHFNFYHSLWCFKCAKMCADEEDRRKHLEKAHNIVASCKVCGANFLSKPEYLQHLQSLDHAVNLKKLDYVKKDALYSNSSPDSSEMVIISDDDIPSADDGKVRNELKSRFMNKKLKREQFDWDKGRKCPIPVKIGNSKSSDLKGVKRKHDTDVGTMDAGKKKGLSAPSVVGQYCDLCKHFYKKYRTHITTLKHLEKVMASK